MILDAGCQQTLQELIAQVSHAGSGSRRFVIEIPGGFVQGTRCSVVAPDASVLIECGPHRGRTAERHRALCTMPIAIRRVFLAGTTAVIGAPGPGNFYHWLIDTIPRIGLVRAAGIRHPDRWVTAPHLMPRAMELLERCGLARTSIRPMRRGELVRCERLIAPTFAAPPQEPTTFIAEFLRDALAPCGPQPQQVRARRLYITRSGSRRVSNEAEILDALGRFGFERVDLAELDLDAQSAVMSQAEAVIGPHGAGLANMVHCPRGAAIAEFIPPSMRDPCFYCLSGACGLRYACIPGLGSREGSGGDFTVDPKAVAAVAAEMTRNRP